MIPVRLRSWVLSLGGPSSLAFTFVPALMSGILCVQATLGVAPQGSWLLPVVPERSRFILLCWFSETQYS